MPIDITKLTIEEILDLKRRLAAVRYFPRTAQSPAIKRSKLSEAKSWDWNKPNFEIASEHACSAAMVSCYRKALGLPKYSKYFPACNDWDWAHSDTAIARENKVNVASVSYWRKRLNKPAAPRDYVPVVRPIFKPKEYNFDWLKCDIDLAREHEITRERVRQIRALKGIPKRHFKDVKYDAFLNLFRSETKLTIKQVREKLKAAPSTIRGYCARAGIELCRPKRTGGLPWSGLDFRLPNALLASIWKMSEQQVASHRCNHTLEKALFRHGTQKNTAEFDGIIASQVAKANSHFSNGNHQAL